MSGLNGTSVRTTRCASSVPTTTASAVEPPANANELSVISPRPVSLYAVRKDAKLTWPPRTNVSQSRNPTGTSARYATTSVTTSTIALRPETIRRTAPARANGCASAGAATSA